MTALERILTTPLKATERGGMSSVRVAADSFHVATISAGMNDQLEYARLFAAAPEMLAALRQIEAIWNRTDLPNSGDAKLMYLEARAAIAKATGGQP